LNIVDLPAFELELRLADAALRAPARTAALALEVRPGARQAR
jgi:hypothetical protein